MRLVASMIVRNEIDRYLDLAIGELLEFCDEVRVLDDGSDDGTREWLVARDGVEVLAAPDAAFFRHEGAIRQALLDWTLRGSPDWVLAVDADEFVDRGSELRHLAELGVADVWTLSVEEVWELEDECVCLRVDGGWRPRPAPILYRTPPEASSWRIRDVALACGREPVEVRELAQRGLAGESGIPLLHFGWARRSERERRAARYAVNDGGRFHARSHLDSILWEDGRVQLDGRPWPLLPESVRLDLLARCAS